MRRSGRVVLLAIAVALALLLARAALPFIVKDYVNARLGALEAYRGRVSDVDIGLWRGAYAVEGLRIVKTAAPRRAPPFFTSDRVDFSVEWRSLLDGALVSEAVFAAPTLNLVERSSAQQSQLGKEENWHARLEEYFPFRFNTVEVRKGTVTFRAPGIRRADALTARRVEGVITNLTNAVENERQAFAGFRLRGDVLGEAPLKIGGTLKPFAAQATFDLNLALEGVQLPKVNPWLREYLGADAESGEFALYLELATADGEYSGYAKPLMRDVNIFGLAEPDKNPLRRLWEGVLELAAEALQNQPREQLAARIPFRGSVRGTDTDVLSTIASVLRNAFIGAFAHSLEGSISLRDAARDAPDGTGDSDRRAGADREAS